MASTFTARTHPPRAQEVRTLSSHSRAAENPGTEAGVPQIPFPPTVVVLLAAVWLEIEPLLVRLQEVESVDIAGRRGVRGSIEGRRVLVIESGMGKANAAQALTAVLERGGVRGVVGFGVAGAYVGGGAEAVDAALATREVYGDEGVETAEGWISSEAIGIPLLERGGVKRFNEFPLDERLVAMAAMRLEAGGVSFVRGTFVTVSCCSGTLRRGDELGKRFDAICESMEGAAFAHICDLYDVPFLEVRGVSNRVEDRDLSTWNLTRAAEAAARAAELLVPLFDDTSVGGRTTREP